jgi:hypothetical protein
MLKMYSLKFPPWGLRDLVNHYLSRQVESDGRLSPLTAVLIVTAISVALWAGIAALIMHFI